MSDLERLCHPFTRDEMERRWAGARRLMRDRGIDALVMQNSNDWLGGYVRWFTGITANNAYPRAVVFPLEGDMSLVQQGPFGGVTETGGGDPTLPGVGRVLTTPSYVSAESTAEYDADIVIDEIRRGGHRSIGMVAPAAMYYGFGAAVVRQLDAAGATVEDVTDMIDGVKAVKSPEEQERVRRAAELQDEVLRQVCEFIRPGRRDFEVAAFAQYTAQLLGSEQGIYLGSSAPSGHPAMFRPRWLQGREIAAGDSFTLLIETNGPGGMYAELARPIVLGRASAEQKEGWEFLLRAQDAVLADLVPGTPCAEVYERYDRLLAEAGRPPERRLFAHGQGYDLVERPLIRQDETMAVAEGMNLTVHPAMKTDSLFLAVVDNYLIGPEGPGDCLHGTPKEIIEIG